MKSLYEYILSDLKQSEILSAVVNSLNDPCCDFNFQVLYFSEMYSEISFACSIRLILLYHIASFLSIDKKDAI